jgi:hypothetical protein
VAVIHFAAASVSASYVNDTATDLTNITNNGTERAEEDLLPM